MSAANLFFAFKNASHIHRQSTRGAQVRFDRFHVAEKLSFVVCGAAAVEVLSLYCRAKRRTAPFSNGLAGQDIVMAIDDERWAIWSAQPRCINNRIAALRDHADTLQADVLQMPRQPVRTTLHVFLALGLRADAGEAQEFLQLREEPGAVRASVGEGGAWIHGSSRGLSGQAIVDSSVTAVSLQIRIGHGKLPHMSISAWSTPNPLTCKTNAS